MIFSQFLNLIYYFLFGILSLLPTGELSTEITGSITTFFGYLKYIKPWFPVETLLTVLGLILATEIIILGYYLVMWIIHRIPTQ